MLMKRTRNDVWRRPAAVGAAVDVDNEADAERGPAVIPFRGPAGGAGTVAPPGPQGHEPQPEPRQIHGSHLLLESDQPAQPWSPHPAQPLAGSTAWTAAEPVPPLKGEGAAPSAWGVAVDRAGPDAPQPSPIARGQPAIVTPSFPRLTRAEAADGAVLQEPFRTVLQRYAGDHEAAAAPQELPSAPPVPLGTLAVPEAASAARAAAPARAAPSVPRSGPDPAEAARRAYELLCALGLAEDVAEETLLEAIRVMPTDALTDSDRLVEVALARLVAGLPAGPSLGQAALAGRALCFIGPSGVGKTTTLLKTAVRLRDLGIDTGIVGADLSHVGAREQLERYGELLQLCVSFAYTPEEAVQALAAAPPNRVMLVDTAACGPGPRTPAPLQAFAPELAALLSAIPRRVPVVVVPVGTNDGDLRRLALLARATAAAAAAVTKLDEAVDAPQGAATLPAAGLALNVLARLRLPLLLCGTGRDLLRGHSAPAAMELAVAALECAATG